MAPRWVSGSGTVGSATTSTEASGGTTGLASSNFSGRTTFPTFCNDCASNCPPRPALRASGSPMFNSPWPCNTYTTASLSLVLARMALTNFCSPMNVTTLLSRLRSSMSIPLTNRPGWPAATTRMPRSIRLNSGWSRCNSSMRRASDTSDRVTTLKRPGFAALHLLASRSNSKATRASVSVRLPGAYSEYTKMSFFKPFSRATVSGCNGSLFTVVVSIFAGTFTLTSTLTTSKPMNTNSSVRPVFRPKATRRYFWLARSSGRSR